MKKQQGTGLLALLGIGAGVYAWWKYKNLSPEKKEELHAKVNDVGQKVKDTYNDVESTVKSKYDDFKNGVQKEAHNVQKEANNLNN
ncbi:MAG: YtxH domain-containing protein [Gelidibacter sp.]